MEAFHWEAPKSFARVKKNRCSLQASCSSEQSPDTCHRPCSLHPHWHSHPYHPFLGWFANFSGAGKLVCRVSNRWRHSRRRHIRAWPSCVRPRSWGMCSAALSPGWSCPAIACQNAACHSSWRSLRILGVASGSQYCSIPSMPAQHSHLVLVQLHRRRVSWSFCSGCWRPQID